MLKFLDQATTSIKHLSERVEQLKGKKEELEKNVNDETRNVHKLQLVRVREIDLKLEAILIIMANNKRAVPSEVFRVIEECGAQIMSSSFSTVGHYIYCTIHAQVYFYIILFRKTILIHACVRVCIFLVILHLTFVCLN